MSGDAGGLPSGVGERDGPDGLMLSVRWFGAVGVVLGLLALVWNGLMCVVAGSVVLDGELARLLYLPCHAVVGLVVGYVALAHLINATRITADREGVRVRHGPLPWPGGRWMSVAEIDQLQVEEQVIPMKNGPPQRLWHLKARARTGRELDLVRGLRSEEAARYLEQRVRSHLGLEGTFAR